jgi:hypothetical protein
MAVTVRIPTPLRTLTGGADEVPDRGWHGGRGDREPRCEPPGHEGPPVRRQGGAALREPLRERRGHSFPRQPRDGAQGGRHPEHRSGDRGRSELVGDALDERSSASLCAATLSSAEIGERGPGAVALRSASSSPSERTSEASARRGGVPAARGLPGDAMPVGRMLGEPDADRGGAVRRGEPFLLRAMRRRSLSVRSSAVEHLKAYPRASVEARSASRPRSTLNVEV